MSTVAEQDDSAVEGTLDAILSQISTIDDYQTVDQWTYDEMATELLNETVMDIFGQLSKNDSDTKEIDCGAETYSDMVDFVMDSDEDFKVDERDETTLLLTGNLDRDLENQHLLDVDVAPFYQSDSSCFFDSLKTIEKGKVRQTFRDHRFKKKAITYTNTKTKPKLTFPKIVQNVENAECENFNYLNYSEFLKDMECQDSNKKCSQIVTNEQMQMNLLDGSNCTNGSEIGNEAPLSTNNDHDHDLGEYDSDGDASSVDISPERMGYRTVGVTNLLEMSLKRLSGTDLSSSSRLIQSRDLNQSNKMTENTVGQNPSERRSRDIKNLRRKIRKPKKKSATKSFLQFCILIKEITEKIFPESCVKKLLQYRISALFAIYESCNAYLRGLIEDIYLPFNRQAGSISCLSLT